MAELVAYLSDDDEGEKFEGNIIGPKSISFI